MTSSVCDRYWSKILCKKQIMNSLKSISSLIIIQVDNIWINSGIATVGSVGSADNPLKIYIYICLQIKKNQKLIIYISVLKRYMKPSLLQQSRLLICELLCFLCCWFESSILHFFRFIFFIFFKASRTLPLPLSATHR